MTNPKSIAVLAVAMAALVAVMSFSIAVDGAEEPEYDQDLGTKYSYEIQFSFTGKDALSVTWDFGDGSEPVTAFYPQHTFPDKGTYYVTQDAYNTYDPDGDGEGSHSIAVYKITIAGYPWIEFNSNGGSDVATIQQDDFGVAADKPADPTRTGYTFAGWYTDEDLVYLRRIIELKGLGFSLVEIRRIFELKDSDRSGNLRRKALLSEYRKKLDEDLGKLEALQKHIDELEWHIHQLEKAEDGFTECPGALCASCQYRTRCTFFRSEGEKPSAD